MNFGLNTPSKDQDDTREVQFGIFLHAYLACPGCLSVIRYNHPNANCSTFHNSALLKYLRINTSLLKLHKSYAYNLTFQLCNYHKVFGWKLADSCNPRIVCPK